MWRSVIPSVPALSSVETYLSSIRNIVTDHPVLSSCAASAVLYGLWFFKRPRNMPPGPYGYPLVGSQLAFGEAIKDCFKALREKYGDIITMWLGGNRLVLYDSTIAYLYIKETY